LFRTSTPETRPRLVLLTSLWLDLLVLLILLLLGAVPTWPYSRQWGYGPSGIVGVLMLILLLLLIFQVLPWGWGPGPVVVH